MVPILPTDSTSPSNEAIRFGSLTVTSRSSSKGNRFWVCLCDCGKTKDFDKYSLLRGAVKSCNCAKKLAAAKRIVPIPTGTRFGRLIVEGPADSVRSKAAWRCRCDCGNAISVTGYALRKGHTKSCDCLNREINSERLSANLIGERFGRLLVQERNGTDAAGNALWRCLCNCGKPHIVNTASLRSGNTKSCGCLHKEASAAKGRARLVPIDPGTRFGQLVVEGLGEDGLWRCKCDCGNEALETGSALRSGDKVSCNCLAPSRLILPTPGDVFGKLKVAGKSSNKCSSGSYMWDCVCECGGTSSPTGTSLMRGAKSCGCTKSHVENELAAFVKSLDPTAIRNDRQLIAPKEVDVLVPGKLAVELHGLHWHGEERKGVAARTDSFDKIGLLDRSGIPRRFIFFEDEWLEHRSAVEGYIRAALSTKERIGARKCQVVEGGADFIAQNHIQGSPASGQTVLALSYGGAVLAAAAFRKRGAKTGAEGTWELTRYCVGDVSVAGGLSKLMAEFWRRVPDATSLATFSDRRLSQGAIYVASGFKKAGDVVPRYWYTRGKKRFHRFSFRKDALKARGWLAEGETEAACMLRMGYDRIWDAGKVRWELVRPG